MLLIYLFIGLYLSKCFLLLSTVPRYSTSYHMLLCCQHTLEMSPVASAFTYDSTSILLSISYGSACHVLLSPFSRSYLPILILPFSYLKYSFPTHPPHIGHRHRSVIAGTRVCPSRHRSALGYMASVAPLTPRCLATYISL